MTERTETICPICGYTRKKCSLVETHMIDVHNISPQDYYINLGEGTCSCGCGKQTTWLGLRKRFSKLIKGHNVEWNKKFNHDHYVQSNEKRSRTLSGRTGWSNGLTKENDSRVKLRAQKTAEGMQRAVSNGTYVVWSKGLTKETDERLRLLSKKLKQQFSDGERSPWSKGLTKETDEKITLMAFKVSQTHTKKQLRNHLDNIKRRNEDNVKELINNTGTLTYVSGYESYKNEAKSQIDVQCNVCKSVFKVTLISAKTGRCHICDPLGSNAQVEIANYIKDFGLHVETNTRKIITPLELDVYVPSHNLAIEFNGLYFHSEQRKTKFYHEKKSKICESNNIRLIHIFEDEWRDKKEIVKSIIKNKIGYNTRKIHARKCMIRILSKEERQHFFNSNHIDGDVAASICFGLIHNNEIVSAISLRKPFHKKWRDDYFEIARFCSSLETNVIGGLSKLTKHCLIYSKQHGKNKLLTYVDKRLGTIKHNSWNMSGWKTIDETDLRFWWTDHKIRYNRFQFKADKSIGLTERDVATNVGVVRIWGCGCYVCEYQ